MIVSTNIRPDLHAFEDLISNMNIFLNNDAKKRPEYYIRRNGSLLEDDVKLALDECARGTLFEGTIEKISGQKFPDIIASKFYGIEVKSTKDNHWTTTGGSILETTRVSGIERIYMTFGKLGGPNVEFITRPYEECLYGIAVTHMPRYLIDMCLKSGETIFDKIGISYNDLRQLENPIVPVSKYYRSKLQPGETLWWTGDSMEETVSATIRLWKNLTVQEKKQYTTYACVFFPEVIAGIYDNYVLWLASQGIVDPHIRDQFSAGGQEDMLLSNGEIKKFPGVYRRIKNNKEDIVDMLQKQGTISVLNWCKKVSELSCVDYDESLDALRTLFHIKSVVE